MEPILGLVAFLVVVGLFVIFIKKSLAIAEQARLMKLGVNSVRESGTSVRSVASAAFQGAKQSYAKRQSTTEVEARLVKYQALEKLKTLLDNGAISDEEFKAEKAALLGHPTA